MNPGTLAAFKNLGFEPCPMTNEGKMHLNSNKLIPLPRYTLCYGFIKYRIPMIQFYKEDLFPKSKIKKNCHHHYFNSQGG